MARQRYQHYGLVSLVLFFFVLSSTGSWTPADESIEKSLFIHAEKEIHAEQGGILPVTYNGLTYAYFGVYPGTIEDDVLLTIDASLEKEDDQITGVVVDFGPDGLQFAPPYALLSLERPFLNLFEGARLAIYDEYGNQLWESEVIGPTIRRILLRFKHFSLYYFERR